MQPSNSQSPRAMLPSYPTSAAAKRQEAASNLREAIERLIDSERGDATTLNLLAAIAKCPIWDEQSDREFRRLGFSVASEIYDLMMMNADFGFAIDDPNNPRNWDGYFADGEQQP